MKHKCEWCLDKDITAPFRKVIRKGTKCSFDDSENFYKDKKGKIYCIFHAPSDAINIKTKLTKLKELDLFQKEIDSYYKKYDSSQDGLAKRIKELFNNGVHWKEVENIIKKEKLAPRYDFTGVVFPFSVYLLNQDCMLKKEEIKGFLNKSLLIPTKKEAGILGVMNFIGCDFKETVGLVDFQNEKLVEGEKVDHSLSFLIFNKSVFHKKVSFSSYSIEELFCEECVFKGNLRCFNTDIKKASFKNSVFENQLAFANFSCEKSKTTRNDKLLDERHNWDFRKTQFFGEVSFENRVFSSRTDFTQATFHDKFYFYNTKLYPETYFYKTKFIKRSDFGTDICFNYLIKALKDIEQSQQISTIKEYAQESYMAILSKLEAPQLEEEEWVEEIFKREKELYQSNPETMDTRKARLKEIGRLYPRLKHRKNKCGVEDMSYSDEGFVTKYTALFSKSPFSIKDITKK